MGPWSPKDGLFDKGVAKIDEEMARRRQSRRDSEIKTPKTPSCRNSDPKIQKQNRAKKGQIVFWLETKWDLLPEICGSLEWKQAAQKDEECDLIWSDAAIDVDKFVKLKPYQRINHFVGTSSITWKSSLGKNLRRMKQQFPEEYAIFPETWLLPAEMSDFKRQFSGKKDKTFILKPANGSLGRGIFLIKDVKQIPSEINQMVAQQYIHKPMLLDGYKFDLRLYVLVTGCDPLRVFFHREGLVRLATVKYEDPKGGNIANPMMHLTNYDINAQSPNYVNNSKPWDGNDGHKRSWRAVLEELEKRGENIETIQSDIEEAIVKTLISVQPRLAHLYHQFKFKDVGNSLCFEILGFDVMLDRGRKPWIIEVNSSPAFHTKTELDEMVKSQVIRDAFKLLNMTPETKRRFRREAKQALAARALGVQKKTSIEERLKQEEVIARQRSRWEGKHCLDGGYRVIYPAPTKEKEEKYARYLQAATNIWSGLTGQEPHKAGLLRRSSSVALEMESSRSSNIDSPLSGRRATVSGDSPRKSSSVDPDSPVSGRRATVSGCTQRKSSSVDPSVAVRCATVGACPKSKARPSQLQLTEKVMRSSTTTIDSDISTNASMGEVDGSEDAGSTGPVVEPLFDAYKSKGPKGRSSSVVLSKCKRVSFYKSSSSTKQTGDRRNKSKVGSGRGRERTQHA